MADSVKHVPISLASIPRVFNVSKTNLPCAKDIIAFVRGTIEEDPWVPIVLDTKDNPVFVRDLELSLIYWNGVNDNKVNSHLGINSISHCVIPASRLNLEDEDCGFLELTADFSRRYNVAGFEVLMTGGSTSEEAEKLSKLLEFINKQNRDDVSFPMSFIKQNKLVEHGIDISVYASEIDTKRTRNSLFAETLDAILDDFQQKIVPGESVIQDLSEYRTSDVKILTTYLILKYNLPPVYVASFISEYIRYQFLYPFRELSLYERISFLRRMPKLVGYIGNNQNFSCYAQVLAKIYPTPHYVFDLEEMKVLPDDEAAGDDWNIGNGLLKFADFRGLFRGSSTAINYSTSMGIGGTEEGDAKTNRQLIDLFAQVSALVPEEEEPLFLSIKNTLYCERDGKRYLVYAPEECGIRVALMSEYFGVSERVLSESEFSHLIDAQLEKAILARERADNMAKGNNELAVLWKNFDPELALKPAIPYEVSLYKNLLPPFRNGLSYYDRLLRCHQDVLPIITTLGSPNNDVSPLFSEVSMSALRSDPQARYAISCCGTLSAYYLQDPVLPITYKAFKHRRLLS